MTRLNNVNTSHSTTQSKIETLGVVLLLITFTLLSLLICTRTPAVFNDEVVYVDPAANLYFHNGFSSTMWAQGRQEFWCGNVPLYQGILFLTYKCFGFGFLQTRAINLLLTVLGASLVWAGVRMTNLIKSPAFRLLGLLLLLSGSVSNKTFRVGRYDTTMFFVCSIVFFIWGLPSSWKSKKLLLVASGALLPFAGVPLLPYTAMMLLFILILKGFGEFKNILATGIGLISGLFGLYSFYRHFGAWQEFMKIVLPFTGAGHLDAAGKATLGDFLIGKHLGEESLLTSFFGNPLSHFDEKNLFDISAFLLFIVLIFLTVLLWKKSDSRARKVMVFGFMLTLVLPPFMATVGHYRSFYRWMSYIPLTWVVMALLENTMNADLSVMRRMVIKCVMGISIFMGIPFYTVTTLTAWTSRSERPLERIAEKLVHADDVVICDFKSYFAVKSRARIVYCCGLVARGDFSKITDLPSREVTLLCIFPDEFDEVTKTLGGKWHKVDIEDANEDKKFRQTRYALDFYRRE
jgi:hypothetical protein